MYCNAHSLTCAGNVHKQQLVVLACFSGWERRGDVDPVTSKVLGHSPPPPPFPRSLLPPLTPPPTAGMWLTLMMSLHFSALPVSTRPRGRDRVRDRKKREREIKRRMACTVHLPFTITTLGSAVRLNRLPQRRNARRPSNRVIQQPPG